MPPAVVDAINNHRAALLAREQAAMQANARAWLGVEQAIQAQVDALAYELAQNPGSATMGQIVRSRRYRALMEQVRDELRKYEDFIEPRIRSGQADMITAALEHSRQAVNAVATEAQMIVQFDRLPVSAVNDSVGLAGDGSPLRAVLQDASRVGPDALAQQLHSGIALGKNPIAVARQAIRLGLGQSFTRMQTIYRTEMLRTYRETTLASYANSRVVVGYKRLSARDDRVCPACLMADGRVYRVEDGFDEHPNGRCTLIPILANVPPVRFQTGQEWFRQQPEATQRRILGAGRFDLWRSGDASLDDMISRDWSDDWGGSLRPTRVRDLASR
jgi:SPP1 gp7 family putative phage head morphogenesis protein